ncbi:heparan-alpha-glucosaminide N-acetyltransferase [Lycorma delicatula]|uniref:heparan-alpha-glucosaminide N-acetyltransferase n=1 Tax=Lycorma delicatula TaxID=130591 RepID=UPI003F512547
MAWWENPGTKTYKNLDLSSLDVDEAYLNITNIENTTLYLYSLSEQCYKCPFSLVTQINEENIQKVDTQYNVTWRLYRRSDQIIPVNDTRLLYCEIVPENFGEFGIYDWIIEDGKCNLFTMKQPVSTELPLILTILGIVIISCIYYILNNLMCRSKRNTKSDNTDDNKELTQLKKSRVLAVDAFRGLCIILMIFVNDGGGHYWFFEHATWNGLLIADLLFPWFMWIMGVCIPIVVKSQLKKGVSRISMFQSVFRRSCMLFILGLALNTVSKGPSLETLRIFGVLQRFGVAYLVVATISTFLTFRSHDILNKNKVISHLKDIIILFPQWIPIALILAGHVYLTFYVPIPGCPLGYLGPGGIQDDGKYSNCTGGMAGYIDELILGRNHVFQHPTISAVYKSQPFDPEGLLGCLTSIFQVFLGVQAGAILIYHQRLRDKLRRWLVWGVLCIIAGLVLCECRIEGGWIPINKNLWSISFVMITSGLGYIVLSLLYFSIDHCKCWNGAPLIYPGMNSVLLFIGHTVTYQMFPWHWSISVMNTHIILMLEAVWGTALWIYIAYWLYTCQFFLKL